MVVGYERVPPVGASRHRHAAENLAAEPSGVAALIHRVDWEATALGAVETWPQSLRDTLGIILNSKLPMMLWWGAELLQFYNDACCPLLRARHPAALGRPAAEIWDEVWHELGERARATATTGCSSWQEDHKIWLCNGEFCEEVYLTFSIGPVPDSARPSQCGGVLLTLHETTARVQDERTNRMLHDLSKRTSIAKAQGEAYQLATDVLAGNPDDFPFALLYQVDYKTANARLVGRCGTDRYGGLDGANQVPLSRQDTGAGWPLAEVFQSRREVMVDDLVARFGLLSEGTRAQGPSRALVLPLLRPGKVAPHGFLIAGISPHRRLDHRYRQMLRSTAEQVAGALANAHAYQVEQKGHAIFEKFFTISLDMMCIAGLDGYFRRLSPGFEVLGYSHEELLSRPFIEFVHPDDVAATLAEVENLSEGISTKRFENRYRCKNGTYRWLAWTCATDAEGALYAVARDVTAEKLTQEALASAKEKAEAASRELESFSYSVAHDLRAPLRSIDGFSQALLEDCAERLDDAGKKYLSFVRQSAQHMATLIDDLLALSRVTRAELRCEPVDLSALAGTVMSRLRRVAPERVVDLVIQPRLTDEGDPRLLEIMFDNLLGNAWKFTSKQAAACVEFGRCAHPTGRAYYVRDNGAGFDMRYANKLFGVFQRLHSGEEFEGTGIGLATVQRVVRRHAGRVWAEGAVGRGATFYFTLHDRDDAHEL
jgi:PAS domain S-box-containing protein